MSASFRRNISYRSSSRQPATSNSKNLITDKEPLSAVLPDLVAEQDDARPSNRLPASRTITKTPTTLGRKGTRPWVSGLTLTSSGLRELDAILGGGQPLGTILLLEEDRWTQDLALAISRCWCAEAVSQGQILSLVASRSTLEPADLLSLDVDRSSTLINIGPPQQGMTPDDLHAFLSLLPKDLHLEKERRADGKTCSTVSSKVLVPEVRQPFMALTEEGDDEDFDEEAEMDQDGAGMSPQEVMDRSDAGLTNAWQYKQSVQRERMGKSSVNLQKKTEKDKVFCHSYDLSGKMQDQYSQKFSDNNLIQIVDGSCKSQNLRASATFLFQRCLTHIESEIRLHPNQVIRLLISNAPIPNLAIALPLILTAVRFRSIPVVLLITTRPWTLPPQQVHYLTSLRRTSDAVFLCEGFAATTSSTPPEFSDLAGLLSIKKLALNFGESTTKTRPPSNRYGMKRDRRKLHLRMLHLPPEDFSKGGSSVGAGSERSGGGRIDVKNSSQRTALEPGMACGRNLGAGVNNNGLSLEF